LAEDLRNLQDAVDGADADPGPDVRSAYIALSRSLDCKL
jgi:hypothetical protein